MTSATQANSRVYKHIQHVGKRPKGDQDNSTREKLCCLLKDSGKLIELVPERLYVAHLNKDGLFSDIFCSSTFNEDSPFIVWTSDTRPSLLYDSFSRDFGPFNLATTHQFCSQLKVWVDTYDYRHPDKCILIVLEDEPERRLNVTLAAAIAAMLLFNLKDEEVIQRLNFSMVYKPNPGESCSEIIFKKDIKKYVDVSGNTSVLNLGIDDCIKAFYAAVQLGFYNYYDFDHAAYLHYETVTNGDINWIIPGKILAFAGPTIVPNKNYVVKFPPVFYRDYFNEQNVTTIVRLNDIEYAKTEFTEYGFDHHDLIFPDGFPPTSTIANKFINIVDESRGAVAVHCYAGIGRTGTLIAAYLMARYNFTPQMAVAWTRICRPGSVIGEQQDWLVLKFDSTKSPVKPVTKPAIRGPVENDKKATDVNSGGDLSYEAAEKIYGQARALLMKKKQRKKIDRPETRSTAVNKPSVEDIGLTGKRGCSSSKVDIVLDLGKTVPLDLQMKEMMPLQGKKNPKFYHMIDGKYEWKVKFPQSQVHLKHRCEEDIKSLKINEADPSTAHGPPILVQHNGQTPVSPVKYRHTKRAALTFFNIVPVPFHHLLIPREDINEDESD